MCNVRPFVSRSTIFNTDEVWGLIELETIATYEPATQTFDLHSPTITATKWSVLPSSFPIWKQY